MTNRKVGKWNKVQDDVKDEENMIMKTATVE